MFRGKMMQTRTIKNVSDAIEFRPVSMVTRPLRLGYVVNRSVDFDVLRRVFQYNCSIWGGKYNFFVPTDGETIREDWWRMLLQHDPDYLIHVGHIEPDLSEKIRDRLQPFWQYAWGEDWIQGFLDNRNRIGAIPVIDLLKKHYDSDGDVSPEQSRCIYPKIEESLFEQILELVVGIHPSESAYREAFLQVLGASEIVCKAETLTEYLTLLDELDKRVIPIDFTGQYLRISYGSFVHQPSLIVTDGTIDDFFLFHAARASAWSLPGKPLLIVPVSEIEIGQNLVEIAEWLKHRTQGNILDVASVSIGLEQLRNLRESIRQYLPDWQINLCCCNFEIWAPRVIHEERQRLISFRGQEVSFEIPEIVLSDFLSGLTAWVTELRQSAFKMFRRGFAPSMFPSLNYTLSGSTDPLHFHMSHGSNKRIARGELALRVGRRDEVMTFELPAEDKIFEGLFTDSGFDLNYDEKGRYYTGMVELAGGKLKTLDFLQNEGIRNVLARMKSGKGYTWSQILSKAKLGQDAEKRSYLQDLVFDLAHKRILLRGMSLCCPNCDLTTWYDFNSLSERMVCQGCGMLFQMALDNEHFCYRLNELFARGIDQGALTVLLTALLLFKSTTIGFHWKAGCCITSDKHGLDVDFDIVAMCDGGLVVAECKDNLERDLKQEPERIQEQLRVSVEAAGKVNADLFILATLNTEIPQVAIDIVTQAAAIAPQMSVLFIKKTDLERGWMIEVTEDQNEKRLFIDKFYKQLPKLQDECYEYDPIVKSGGINWG